MRTLNASRNFFTDAEQACAAALLGLLTGQDDDQRIPLLEMVDAQPAAGETVGWRCMDMTEDGQAWRDTLHQLDADAVTRYGTTFAAAPQKDQEAILQSVLDGTDRHGMPAAHVWSLWTRYACTALYSHPYPCAWDETGYQDPAYLVDAGMPAGKAPPGQVPEGEASRS
jgi:hypothetical protein